MKKNYPYIFSDNEFNKRRHPSYFKRALANFTVLFSIVGVGATIMGISYFGIIGGLNEMERQDCEGYQSYLVDYPESVLDEKSKLRCEIIGFNFE